MFMLKALFVPEIFIFCPDLLVMWKNGLIKNPWLISKFMTSQIRQ